MRWALIGRSSVATARRLHTSNRCSYPRSKQSPQSAKALATPSVAYDISIPPKSAIPSHLRSLQSHLFTSFLPTNQPCEPRPSRRPITLTPGVPVVLRAEAVQSDQGSTEQVLALVTPYEGGDFYIFEAVQAVAGTMDAEVQRLDLALAVGLEGEANLGFADAGPVLPTNPARPVLDSQEEPEDDDEEPRMIRLPFFSSSTPDISQEWVAFFTKIIEPAERRRIILLESVSAMSSTFHVWYPAFLEAVHRRRRGAKKSLTFPTTVVFSCAPSLLPVHSADPTASGDVWWGGDEANSVGREQREAIRETVLTNQGPSGLVPAFKTRLVSHALLIKTTRDLAREAEERHRRRQALISSQLSSAVAKLGGRLLDTGSFDQEITQSQAERIASSAIGRVMASRHTFESPAITWSDLEAARAEEPEPIFSTPPPPAAKHNSYEQRLVGCVVDSSRLRATFNDVHLPHKTIDAIRTLVQLPLLFPDAFRGGVLRDHAAGGALLFGPPGTGKTLLARAVAAESGAQMLAIQPSDVNNMYVGESEKIVKAVFSLARKLSPCVIFLDEVDALFGTRASEASAGNRAHHQVLTEFMQEMDGLTSAAANKDKRIVVIGATNRPFDLDEAVLRRLPRRIMIDLPGMAERKAILEILLRDESLGPDVDIDQLAKDTDGFSGSDLKIKEGVEIPWNEARETGPLVAHASYGWNQEVVSIEHEAIPQGVVCQIERDPPVTTRIVKQRVSRQHGLAAKDLSATPDRRTLSAKHFQAAMAEIRPSSGEEGTLPEIRKWAEQYGEGGKLRKKGFGQGFGFRL